MDQEKIGKFIARRRKERGLLQKEIAGVILDQRLGEFARQIEYQHKLAVLNQIEPIRRRTPPDHPGI